MDPPVIAFLSDYGSGDGFAGICHAVIVGACPAARVIDLDHGIASHDVRAGAVVLARALPFLPDGAIVLADVDPGDARRLVAVTAADGRRLVGPDNGLLWPALQIAGGARAAVDVGDAPVARRPISATFRGRDVLAPVAAAIAAGVAASALGPGVAADGLVALALPVARVGEGAVHAHVVAVDGFGNLELDATPADLAAVGRRPGDAVALSGCGRDRELAFARAFADVADGELVIYEDPQARLAVAVNRGSAARVLGLGADDELILRAP